MPEDCTAKSSSRVVVEGGVVDGRRIAATQKERSPLLSNIVAEAQLRKTRGSHRLGKDACCACGGVVGDVAVVVDCEGGGYIDPVGAASLLSNVVGEVTANDGTWTLALHSRMNKLTKWVKGVITD